MSEFIPPEQLRPLLAALTAMARDADVEAYVVGGTVRDALLGRATRDVDVAMSGDALAMARGVADGLGGHFVVLDDVQAVARVVLAEPAGVYVDVAALQGTLEQDMRRRDFSIDALAVPLGESRVIDLCGGLADLGSRAVRMNGADVFDADPLRLLRAVRVASELGFAIEPATQAAVRARAPHINRAAAERRRDELARIFALDTVEPALRLLDDLGLLAVLLPEVTAGKGVTQPEQFHAYDVFEHNVRCVGALDVMLATKRPADAGALLWDGLWRWFGWCEATLRAHLAEETSEARSRTSLLKLAALLHDVAKPQTRSVDEDGRVRFFGHADAGAEAAKRIMRRLRYSTKEIEFVAKLVAEHLRPVQLAQAGEVPTRRALYRFHRALGKAAPAVLLLALADAAAARGPEMTAEDWSRQAAYMNSLLVRSIEDEGIVHPPRLLTGHDIMSALGVPEGPAVGKLLEALREAQAVGEVQSREEALAFVKELAREGRGTGR